MSIRFHSVRAMFILMLAVGLTGCPLDKAPTPEASTVATWFAAVSPYASA